MSEPEIHTWWPYVRAASKEALEHIGHAPVPIDIREEIATITGEKVPEGYRLSARDHDFIRTQGEEVD